MKGMEVNASISLCSHLCMFLSLCFQHPCVHDEVTAVSLVGLPALQALLYHCQYFQHVALSASICYRGRYTFHLQPRAGANSGASPQDSDSLGKLVFMSKHHPHDGAQKQKPLYSFDHMDVKIYNHQFSFLLPLPINKMFF